MTMLTRLNRMIFVLLLSLLPMVAGGCGNNEPPKPIVGHTDYNDFPSSDALPGIDITECVYFKRGDDVVLTLWSNNGFVANEAEHEVSGDQVSGTIGDGIDRLKFEANLPHDQAGSVTIADQTFDLAKGKLILVNVFGKEPSFKQLQRDNPTKLFATGATPEEYMKFKPDPEIKAYFVQAERDYDNAATVRVKRENDWHATQLTGVGLKSADMVSVKRGSQTVLVVFTNGTAKAGTQSAEGDNVNATFLFEGDKTLTVAGELKGAEGGTVTLEGQSFDLAKGKLILAYVHGQAVRLKQFQLKSKHGFYPDMPNPQITAFFKEAAVELNK